MFLFIYTAHIYPNISVCAFLALQSWSRMSVSCPRQIKHHSHVILWVHVYMCVHGSNWVVYSCIQYKNTSWHVFWNMLNAAVCASDVCVVSAKNQENCVQGTVWLHVYSCVSVELRRADSQTVPQTSEHVFPGMCKRSSLFLRDLLRVRNKL